MKKKRIMTTILCSMNKLKLQWGENKVEEDPIVDEPDDDLRRAIHDAQMDCRSENEKMKLKRMLANHNKFLYPNCENGQKKLGNWNCYNGRQRMVLVTKDLKIC